jgi:hypothetical protein
MWCLYGISYLQFKYVKAYSAVLLSVMTDRCNCLIIYSAVSVLGLQVMVDNDHKEAETGVTDFE